MAYQQAEPVREESRSSVVSRGGQSDLSGAADFTAADGSTALRRTLTTWQLLLLGIGAIIGAGIFVAPGIVAAEHTGPAIVLSLLLAAAACLCSGLCYAEFAAMMPDSGSAYSYVYSAFGPFAGWMIGWCLILEYLMAAATVAVGWSAYFCSLLHSFGIVIPPALANPTFAGDPHTRQIAGLFNAPAAAILAAITVALLRSVQVSARLTALLVAIKLTAIASFIVCGLYYVNPANWHPFLPPNDGRFGSFGWSGVLQGASMIFYAYLGFDTVSTAAREARDPERSMPWAILGSLGISAAIYIAFSLVLTGLAPYPRLAAPNPASVALDFAGSHLWFLKVVVEVGALLGLTSVILALLYGQSRILYAMARDGLMPEFVGRIGGTTRTPFGATLISGVVALTAASLLPLELLGQLISIGTLAAFVFVCCGVFYLRLSRPSMHRPFRVPCAPAVCIAGAIICAYLIVGLTRATQWRFILWSLLGALLYGVGLRVRGRNSLDE